MPVRRRLAATGVAVAAIFTAVTAATVTPAAADTITVTWSCSSEAGSFTGDYHVTVTAPATAAAGSTHAVSVSAEGATTQDQQIAAGTISATLQVQLGGAGSGVVTATGLTNPEITPGTPWRVAGGTAQVTYPSAGEVTHTPGTLDAGVFTCSPASSPAPVAAVTTVS